jgi:hypothetical protein
VWRFCFLGKGRKFRACCTPFRIVRPFARTLDEVSEALFKLFSPSMGRTRKNSIPAAIQSTLKTTLSSWSR